VPFRLDDALAALRPHAIRQAADGDKHAWEYLFRDLIQGRAIDPIRLDDALATLRPHAIRQAADGDKHALEYLLCDFIQGAKQGRVIDPKVARLVADVLERVLAGGDIEEILGTKAKRGRPHKLRKAVLVHAMVRRLMQLRSQQPGRARRWRSGDAKTAAAEVLEMNLDTVQENYKRVQKLIKKIKDYPEAFFGLGRSGFSLLEQVYLMDQEKAVFLTDFGEELAFRLRWGHLLESGDGLPPGGP
jgi:hypothetical protein